MKIYPKLVDITKYPEYRRRAFKAPSWEDFDNRIMFHVQMLNAIKDGVLTEYEREFDLFLNEAKLGELVKPFGNVLFAENFEDFLKEVQRRGSKVFELIHFVQMADPTLTYCGQIEMTDKMKQLITAMGDDFMCTSNGEKDGMYIGTYAPMMCPAPMDRRAQFLNFWRHFKRMERELWAPISVLTSVSTAGYFAAEGNTVILGAEIAQGLPNCNVYYSLIRGAGKQYGLLWFSIVSCFNRFGYKSYRHDDKRPVETWNGGFYGPREGTSLALMKRLIWMSVLYNCASSATEICQIKGDDWLERAAVQMFSEGPDIPPIDWSDTSLSPVGRIQADAVRIMKERKTPGVHVAPVAFMIDYFSGWVMARQHYNRKIYVVWGNLPYNSGDYLTHSLFEMVFEGYSDSSYFHDEKGFVTPTPYGDMFDTLMSNCPAWALSQYSVIVAAGDLEGTPRETAHNLAQFVESGGTVVLTGANALRMPGLLSGTGVEIFDRPHSFPAGTAVGSFMEDEPFTLLESKIGAGVEILSYCGEMPAAIRVSKGKGTIIVFTSPFGLSDGLPDRKVASEYDISLPMPFPQLKHFTAILDDVFTKSAPFSADPGLCYETCRKDGGRYEILITNTGFTPLPIDLESNIGPIRAIREVSLGEDFRNEIGYFPTGFEDKASGLGEDTDNIIAGLNTRLFEIDIDETAIEILPEIKPATVPFNRAIALDRGRLAEESVRLMPTFMDHFDTVKISWRYLLNTSSEKCADEGEWFKHQKIRVIVDFSDGFNHYPDLTMTSYCPDQWPRSRAMIVNAMDKMKFYGANDAIFVLSRQDFSPKGAPFKTVYEDYLHTAGEFCDLLAERGAKAHFQPTAGRNIGRHERAVKFLDDMARPNLRYCLSASHLISMGEDLATIAAQMADRTEIFLMSSPERDPYGQFYDSHRSVGGSDYEALIKNIIPLFKDKIIVLDTPFAGVDEVFGDLMFMEDLK